MVPTVLERSSWIDRERPVRLYRFDEKGRHKTVRLTYKMGSNDYWGVQESDWGMRPCSGAATSCATSAAAATSSSTTARTCTWSSCERKGATYWVVNTLARPAPNETMLAIAKGLRPASEVHASSQ